MGKPDRKPKEPEEDLDIKATLHKLLQNTKGIPEMNAEVTGLKTQLKRTNDVLIPGLQTQIAALKTDVKEMSGDIEVQDSRLKDLEDRFEKLENENKLLQEELVKVKGLPSKPPATLDNTQIEDKVQTLLRRQERLTHLLIDGVCENPNENVLEQVGLILYDTQLNLDRNSIRKVYRLGVLNEKNWRPRPIVVEFDTRETRDQVFRARYNIKTNPNCANVWINERLDDEQRTQRMEMRALADLAKEQQREARVVGDTLIVSGIKYKHADIYKLPDDISLEMAFTRTDGEYIFFNSEHSFLSAFYPVDFEYKKQDYQNAEQAHAHRKAKDNGHHDIGECTQGSVLGPLLFILYLNDIVECVKNCKYFMYADDIVIYKDIDTLTNPHCIDDMQNDLDRIVTWCRLNELTINVKKTKAQFFPRNRNLDLLAFKDNHALTIDNVNVGYMDTFRYLGVEIQSDLLFKAHINRLNKNASHKLFLLRRLRNVLTNQASILVLKSMFLGVLDYGLLFVSNVPVKMFDDLQTIQNHALRAVLNIQDPQDLNIVEMHDLVHVKMLRHRMLIQLLMCMRNAFINQSLSIISRNVVTRGNDGATFDLPVPRIELLRKCPFYLGTLIWNQLPYNIRVTDSKPVFKSFITKGIIYNTIRTVFQD